MIMRVLYPVLLLAFAGGHAYAACTYPTAPKDMPHGKTATLETMVAAQKAVKEFDAAITAYNDCLQTQSDAELAKIDQSDTDDKKKEARKKKVAQALLKKQNAAIDADKALAARFNEQLRIFKARDKE
jgi:hypothetical protein